MNITIDEDVRIEDIGVMCLLVRVVRGEGGRPVLHAHHATRISNDGVVMGRRRTRASRTDALRPRR